MLGRQGRRAACRALGWQQVGEGNGLLAMGTEPAGPDAVTELLALLAPLLPQVARTARWTLVDRRGLGQTDRHRREWCRMTAPPRGLAAGGARGFDQLISREQSPPRAGSDGYPAGRLQAH